MNPILILDTNYLCHRAYHAIGDLSHGSHGTGAIFGVLRDIVSLQDEFKTDRIVFAFDIKRQGHRHGILPTYKSSRYIRHSEESVEEQEARQDFREQVERLRRRYLLNAGFNNIFGVVGFEADDIIASIAAALPSNEEAIIVSSDKDLWQCLRPNVYCWNAHTRKAYTRELFRAEWGIEPFQWADVKAYAGCTTDDVPGVAGVGEPTAAKWLRGELGTHTKTHQKLDAAGDLHKQNMRLVRLPYPGTPSFEIKQDEVTEAKWQALADDLGMRSIRSTVPRGAARKSKGRRRDREKGFGFNR